MNVDNAEDCGGYDIKIVVVQGSKRCTVIPKDAHKVKLVFLGVESLLPFCVWFFLAYIHGKIHAITQSETTPWLLTLPYKGINVYWIGESLGNCSGYEFNSYESLLIAVQTDHVQGISY